MDKTLFKSWLSTKKVSYPETEFADFLLTVIIERCLSMRQNGKQFLDYALEDQFHLISDILSTSAIELLTSGTPGETQYHDFLHLQVYLPDGNTCKELIPLFYRIKDLAK